MSKCECEEDTKEYRDATWSEAPAIAFIGPPALFILMVIISIGLAVTMCALPFAALLKKIKVEK